MQSNRKTYSPRVGQCYGMAVHPHFSPSRQTWVEGEMMCSDVGQFRRRGLAYREKTNELVRFTGAIPDTWFSIPATTKAETGFITIRDDGEFKFVPHTDQTQTPKEYRKQYKRDCR